MDFGDIAENIPLIVTVVLLIVFQFIMRKKHPKVPASQNIAQELLHEVKLNLRLVEVFTVHHRAKKFINATWNRVKDKLDFMEHSLQVSLNDSYILIEDYNQQIAAANKHKTTSYLSSIDVSKLRKKLTKSEQELEQWIDSTGGTTTETPAKYPGILDGIIGERR
ncbi:hypothetical protein ACFLW0_04630 [Chloroflexota bacterium]